jgi:hypothetical protein
MYNMPAKDTTPAPTTQASRGNILANHLAQVLAMVSAVLPLARIAVRPHNSQQN